MQHYLVSETYTENLLGGNLGIFILFERRLMMLCVNCCYGS